MTADPPRESELDRAVRLLGRVIKYPDGSLTDRRSGLRVGRIVCVQPVGLRLCLRERGIDPPTDSEIADWKAESAELAWRRAAAERRLSRGR